MLNPWGNTDLIFFDLILFAFKALKTEQSNTEPEIRRGRGRPKGAKNKNPKVFFAQLSILE